MKRFLEEEKIEGETESILPSVGEEQIGGHTQRVRGGGRGGRKCRSIARSEGQWWEGRGRGYKMGR